MATKREPITKAQFREYYGIEMPENTFDREMLILGALTEIQTAGVDINERIDNLKQFIIDTKEVPLIQLN